MQKIRLLHCIETISSGGVEKIRLTFAKGLDFDQFELKIICTKAVGPIKEQLKSLGVEIIEVGTFKSPFEWRKYKKVLEIIRNYQPHIIHGAVFEGMSMATVGGYIGNVPVVILEETSFPSTRSKKALLLQRIYSNFADKVIGIAPSVVQFLKEKVKVSSSKVILINNGVDFPETCSEVEIQSLKKCLGIEKDDLVIGSVGRVHDRVKRFSDILKAIKLLDNPKTKFLLVGQGPDLSELTELAIHLGFQDQFIPVGFQEKPDPFYELMDVFCLSSAHEGFGLVAAEAMLHKLPVIATQVGGLQDIVVDNETGFLVPPYVPGQIAEKIGILIDNPQLRKFFGEKGCERALKHYTADRYCQVVENLYLQLLKGKGLIT
ncbi:glycosyltransferase [Pleomorphovibrio marinus]|uniref:glycosyltransferase n=1 Tax=Pleomorphovibrio marinus TaxID=2164132 RepID=UPI000E0B278D|nr:glycosyltransferase [Pleomorphovibrio marinus]